MCVGGHEDRTSTTAMAAWNGGSARTPSALKGALSGARVSRPSRDTSTETASCREMPPAGRAAPSSEPRAKPALSSNWANCSWVIGARGCRHPSGPGDTMQRASSAWSS